MWWLRRMTTVAVPYCRARGMAVSMACAVSQTPGRRRPSQVRQGPVSRTTSGSPGLAHGAGRELLEIAGQQGEPVGGVAHEVGLDQQLADQARRGRPRSPAAARSRAARSIRAAGW